MSAKFSKSVLFSAALLSLAAPLAVTAQPGPQSSQQHAQPHAQSHNTNRQDDKRNNGNARQESKRTEAYRVTTTVNLRSGPGAKTKRLGQVKRGQTVQVDEVRNGWLHIHNQGWISAKYARRA